LEMGKGKLVGGFCQRCPASLHFKHRFRNHAVKERPGGENYSQTID